jgi:hypothetical protein
MKRVTRKRLSCVYDDLVRNGILYERDIGNTV